MGDAFRVFEEVHVNESYPAHVYLKDSGYSDIKIYP
jgi:hypothetical protein